MLTAIQYEWINKESVLPRIEIPVSDHHHSLFKALKRIVRLQVSSEKGKESRRLVLTSFIKSEILLDVVVLWRGTNEAKTLLYVQNLVLHGCNCISSLLCEMGLL